jgi:hypothetical protein
VQAVDEVAQQKFILRSKLCCAVIHDANMHLEGKESLFNRAPVVNRNEQHQAARAK